MNAEDSDLTPRPLPAFVEGARPESAPVPIQRELWPFFVMFAIAALPRGGLLYWRRQTGGPALALPRRRATAGPSACAAAPRRCSVVA